MHTVVVYSDHTGSRLSYILDWLLTERLQLNYIICTDKANAAPGGHCIAYGKTVEGMPSIPDTGLLCAPAAGDTATALTIRPGIITPAIGQWNDLPTLFAEDDDRYTLPFDLFSAAFYLISRYEEYQPYTPDKHGRYPAIESILFKNGWLTRPIVDEWLHAFRQLMEQAWGISITPRSFSFIPSYDIDMAYSHSYKGIKRIAGAYIRALLKGDVEQISQRTQVLKKKVADPYDSFAWLRHLHERLHYKPLYFILCALKTTPFDRNIHPRHPAMIRVIKQLGKEGHVGIHPSYYATHYDQVAKEKATLQDIMGRSVSLSRQHYIRAIMPATFHVLMDNDITDDYSMGYGTHLGFRAGTGSSFPWYDLGKEAVTPLRVHPFCFMDTTAHYDMHLSLSDAFALLREMAQTLQVTHSTLISVFHNFSLGTDPEWAGWNGAYEQFLSEMAV